MISLLSDAKPFALAFLLAAFESVISYDDMLPLNNYCRLRCKLPGSADPCNEFSLYQTLIGNMSE
jgi:hypothetical protein